MRIFVTKTVTLSLLIPSIFMILTIQFHKIANELNTCYLTMKPGRMLAVKYAYNFL